MDETVYSITRESVNSDQINFDNFDDYINKMAYYDPASNCWYTSTWDSTCDCQFLEYVICHTGEDGGGASGGGSSSSSGNTNNSSESGSNGNPGGNNSETVGSNGETGGSGGNNSGPGGPNPGNGGSSTIGVLPISNSQLIKQFFIGLDTELKDCLNDNLDFKTEITQFLTDNFGPIAGNGINTNSEIVATGIINTYCNNNEVNDFEEAIEQYYINNPEAFIELLNFEIQDTKRPIENINDYLDCFNDGKIALSYGYRIYVDQPVNGQRNVFNYTEATPGHTFFTIYKVNTDNTSVNITIGFYPKDNTYKDFGEWDGPGIFQDNGFPGDEHDFDISIGFDDLTNEQFDNIISDIQTIANSDYDLDDNNCTNVAHDLAVNNSGFNMTPSTSVIPILPGAGLCINPGDYGEDLKEMMLDESNPYSDFIQPKLDENDKPLNSDGPCN